MGAKFGRSILSNFSRSPQDQICGRSSDGRNGPARATAAAALCWPRRSEALTLLCPSPGEERTCFCSHPRAEFPSAGFLFLSTDRGETWGGLIPCSDTQLGSLT